MKVLFASDFHSDARSFGVDRFDDVCRAVAQTVKVAREEKVDLYVFSGDLCDPDDPARVLRSVAHLIDVACELEGAGIEFWALPGNHDVIEDGSGRSTISPLAAMRSDDIKVFDSPARVECPPRGDFEAIVLPFTSASRRYDPAQFVKENRSERTKLVIGHMTEISGIEPGEESLEMSRGRGVPFPLAECDPSWVLVNGHWHRGQTFESGGRKVHIPGSLARLTHGEEKSRPQFLLMEI